MIQIAPLPAPKKPAPQGSAAPAPALAAQPLLLKPSAGRTPLSRWLRSGAAVKPQRKE